MTLKPSATKVRNLVRRAAALSEWYKAFPKVAQSTVRSWYNKHHKVLAKTASVQRRAYAIREALRLIKRDRTYAKAKHISVASIRAKLVAGQRAFKLTSVDLRALSVRTITRRLKEMGITSRDRKVPYRGDLVDPDEPLPDDSDYRLQCSRNYQNW